VILHAVNLVLLDDEGRRREGGMYTRRIVEAESADEAYRISASRLLEEREFLEQIWNEDLGEIEVLLDEVDELDDEIDPNDSAYVFYIEEEEQDSES
jgi:hypothetical protein